MIRKARIAGLSATVLLEVVFVAWQSMNFGAVKAEAETSAVVAAFDRNDDFRRRQDVPEAMKITVSKCEVVLPIRDDAPPCVR